jgi:hypothetical protein
MVVGLALVSSILIARKPFIKTNYWQKLSYVPLLLPIRDCRPFRLCRLSKRRVKRPVALIVQCFPLLEQGVIYSQLLTNLCPMRETPLLAYSLLL